LFSLSLYLSPSRSKREKMREEKEEKKAKALSMAERKGEV
jgi:hypothetical protein